MMFVYIIVNELIPHNSNQQENSDGGVRHLYVRINITKANFIKKILGLLYNFLTSVSDTSQIGGRLKIKLNCWCDGNIVTTSGANMIKIGPPSSTKP